MRENRKNGKQTQKDEIETKKRAKRARKKTNPVSRAQSFLVDFRELLPRKSGPAEKKKKGGKGRQKKGREKEKKKEKESKKKKKKEKKRKRKKIAGN